MQILWILILLIGAGMVLLVRHVETLWTHDLLFAGFVFIPISQLAVMGPARLEPLRVTSLAVPIAAMWLATVLMRWKKVRTSLDGGQSETCSCPNPAVMLFLTTALTAIAAIVTDRPRDMPWGVSPREVHILSVSDSLRSARLAGDALPIVANADLGKLSFTKRVLVVDLGLLGDPLMTRLSKEDSALTATYLSSIAMPDVIESHGYWSCEYSGWIESEQFRRNWALTLQVGSDAQEPYSSCPMNGRSTIWTRTGAEPEYLLTREIAVSPDPVAAIRVALSRCVNESGDVFRCQWVRRATSRNMPMLHDRGLTDEIALTFETSPSSQLDIELLLRETGWAGRAFDEFGSLVSG